MSNYLIRILSVKYLSRWLILLIDLFVSTFSSLCAFLLAFFIIKLQISWHFIYFFGAFSALSSLISIYIFKIYKGVIRHSSYTETGRIALASILKIALLALASLLVMDLVEPQLIYASLLFDFLITFFALITIRTIIIELYHQVMDSIAANKKNLLIYLNNEYKDIASHTHVTDVIGDYRMCGYLQMNANDHYRINGYNVYVASCKTSFANLIKKYHIYAVLFLNDQDLRHERDGLVRYCESLQVKMLILPAVNEVDKKKGIQRTPAEVKVEDLLSRDEIVINLNEISNDLANKVVMVTGAAGSIGSELCRQLCKFPIKHLVLYDCAETPMHNLHLELSEHYPNIHHSAVMGDVRDQLRVKAIFERYCPQIVFHAAAYKHVPLMEENPCEAIHTNVFGTKIIADASIKYKAEKFVMVSTDKAVNPTNVMGASKRLAEMYIQSLNGGLKRGEIKGSTRFITTRFGNVLGSNGSVIPLFREQIAKGGPVTVTHPDIIRYFMTIPEACRLVLEAGTMGKGGEIFVFDMGEQVKIADLAKRMISLAGFEPEKDIEIVYTGLRPGEKLFEELLSDEEHTLPTPHEKIRVAGVREFNYNELLPELDDLIQLALKAETIPTVRKMKAIVPEFISKNSVYEKLDEELHSAAV